MTRSVQDVFDIMAKALGRRNINDPDSDSTTFLSYLNDFYSLTMSDDVKLFEQFGTLSFEIDETVTDGVYNLDDIGGNNFANLTIRALISLKEPVDNSVSWNDLRVYQDPKIFFDYWGINNSGILIPGYPTEMLYYGRDLTFRTIPNDTYIVNIYGYKKNTDFSGDDAGTQNLPVDRWVRYLAYGAALNYAQDYRYEESQKSAIKAGYMRERKLMLTNTHNQVKQQRSLPRF